MELRFLIYISYSYACPIGLPLQEEIQKRGYEVKWFGDCEEGCRALTDCGAVLNDITAVLAYNPHIILAITDSVPDFLPGLKVQVFHGFNAEKRSFKRDHFRIRGLFDLYCTQGPSTTRVFKALQKKSPHFEVIETGWSKMDPLFPVQPIQEREVPTIFIASTFTERLSLALNEEVYQEISRLAATGNYKFLAVLHPKLPEEVKKKWEALNGENFTFHRTTDLIPLFKQADFMFSDTTSAIQEFGLQRKPIVTFNHHVPRPYLMNITEVNQIEPAFECAMNCPKTVLDALAEYNAALHPYTDGKSSERVIDACIDFLFQNKSYLKKKPLNLVRKFKMRKKLGYWTWRSYRSPFTL